MGRMVIEVPEELTVLGKAMAEQLAEVQRTMARQGGGKAVDYALVEQAVWEAAGRTEREAHRAILQSLDIDVPAVVIGKERYTRVAGPRRAPPRWPGPHALVVQGNRFGIIGTGKASGSPKTGQSGSPENRPVVDGHPGR
jgi:hypothetical protein